MRKKYLNTGVDKFNSALLALDNHIAICGKSISTRNRYTQVLYEFVMELRKLPEECTKTEIINYFMKCKNERDIGYSTLRGYMGGIKYYLKHIAERMDLFGKIPNPITKKYDITVLSLKEINLLFQNSQNMRELIIIQILYETGIRVSELVNLNLDDFDFYNKMLTIRNSKHRRTRTINFGDGLYSSLKLYIQNYNSLFCNIAVTREFHPFMPLSKKKIRFLLHDLAARSGIKKRVNVHSLRHTFAVHYLNFGGTLYQLQKLLGHSALSTTLHYLQHAVLPESKHVSVMDELMKLKTEKKTSGAKIISLNIQKCL